MEPPHNKVRYVIETEVVELYKDRRERWFVRFKGSWEALCLGRDEPDLCIGDTVRIAIERVKDADLSKTPVK